MPEYNNQNLLITVNTLLSVPLTNGRALLFDASSGGYINGPGAGTINFAGENLGGGIPIFQNIEGTTYDFNTLKAGTNVDIYQEGNQIFVSAVGSAGSGNYTYTVANITARNDLIPSLNNGDQVFVADTGTGSDQYGLYLWNAGNSAFNLIATQNSSEADANTITYSLSYNSAAEIDLGYIASGHRGIDMNITVLTPFNGSSPTLTLGDDINGSATLMAASENDLTTDGQYVSESNLVYTGSSDTLIKAYFTSNSSTVGSANIIISYV